MSIGKTTFFKLFFRRYMAMATITGYTTEGIADELGIPYETAQKRIYRLGLEPLADGKIYPPEALEAVRNVPGRGRPPKKPNPEPSA